MIVLHAGILGEDLYLWGEAAAESGAGRTAAGRARRGAPGGRVRHNSLPRYPFDAGPERLARAVESAPGGFLPDDGRLVQLAAWLPVRAGRAVPSSPMIADAPAGRGRVRLAPWSVTALGLDAEEALTFLVSATERRVLAPGIVASSELAFWCRVLRFAGALVARQRFLPGLEERGGRYLARWEPVVSGRDLEELARLARLMPPPARALGEDGASAAPAEAPAAVVRRFLARMVDHLVRSAQWEGHILPHPVDERARGRAELPSLHDQWLHALVAGDPTLEGSRRELETFARRLASWRRGLELDGRSPFRLCFRLEEPGVDGAAGGGAGDAERARGSGRGDSAGKEAASTGGTAEASATGAGAVSRRGRGAGSLGGEDNGTGRAADPRRWRLRYLLQAADDPSLLVPLEEAWAPRGRRAAAFRRFGVHPREYLLSALGRAARLSPTVEASLAEPQPAGCTLDAVAAHRFLVEEAALLEESGFGLFLPAWWTGGGRKLKLELRARAESPRAETAGALSLDRLLAVRWEVALGGERLSPEELRALVELKLPLVRLRGRWVEVDAAELADALARWARRGEERVAARDLVRMALGGDGPPGAGAFEFAGVDATGWIRELLQRLAGDAAFEELPPPAGFAGTLRPYQQRGYSWLWFLRRWGLGACLADDMGLGKTVQALALVLRDWEADASCAGQADTGALASSTAPAGAGASDNEEPGAAAPGTPERGASRSALKGSGLAAARAAAEPGGTAGPAPVLVVCPMSVVNNWQKEAGRFAPHLPVLVHHGPERLRGHAFRDAARRAGLVVTTYALLHRDFDQLASVQWGGVILDEAQNIKNPGTKQARAARSLSADYRIVLTGTPVENHVGDLWSIMEFLNPGLLGNRAEFRRRFLVPIQASRDRAAMERLRGLTGPFILRRLKTDRSIICDLPEKLEMKCYCTLTGEQASLYAAVLQEAEEALEREVEGIERKGLILATLTRLTQVCNHPAHFLGDGSPLRGRSGKLERLTEMLEEVLDVGERALVFTQFAEMGALLKDHLQETFGREVLFLHGGVPKRRRDEMVERFQRGDGGPPVFILSLKAGGTGLNLTAGTHVFHFDRWWNPAVESQATDRAFRIGQHRNVQVHKFICAGTLEEKIDELIEGKEEVARSVVGTGEAWLTELSNAELRQILALRADAVGE